MDKTLKCIYVMVLFLSIFLVVKKVDALYKCENVEDCPQLYEFTTIDYKCILGTCIPLGVIRKKSAHNYRAENNEFLH
ncbi:unnamed protein product [Lathyrus oleraceus]|uniref:Late nodulin domain-containing protein n=1 Tax=Pisum sativum TaxID=3888 RepID=A0A9D5AV93_PEA|nr:hypothetical protein KIW84_044317 [Pisum sativum]